MHVFKIGRKIDQKDSKYDVRVNDESGNGVV